MRVLVCGPIRPGELRCFPEDLDVTVLGFPAHLTRDEFWKGVDRACPDVVLFQFYANHALITRDLGVRKLQCPRAAWFLDSHVKACRRQELKVAKHFDAIFLTHSEYLPYFRKHKNVHWLPPSLYATTGQNDRFALPTLVAHPPVAPTSPAWDVSFIHADWGQPHPDYPPRAEVLKRLQPCFDRLGLRCFFGEDRSTGFDRMQDSRICLNLSNAGDVNIRNFEILALGRPLVTDRTPDHDRIAGLSEHCHFFDPNEPETLVTLLENAERLDDPERARRGWEYVIGGHTNLHRTLTMIEKLTGRSFEPVRPVDVAMT